MLYSLSIVRYVFKPEPCAPAINSVFSNTCQCMYNVLLNIQRKSQIILPVTKQQWKKGLEIVLQLCQWWIAWLLSYN